MERREQTYSPTKVQRVFRQLVHSFKTWDIPISDKIKPEVFYIKRKDCYALTQKLDSGYFKISVTDLIWEQYDVPTEALRSVLAHELCHTIDGCFNHGKEWKKWVKLLNEEHGFKINPYPYSKKKTMLY